MTIPTKTFLDSIHPYQMETLEAFDSGMYDRFYNEWGRRHRKTTLWLNIVIREACRFPNCAYGLILPFQTEARNVVWDSPDMLRRYLPDPAEMGWTMNEQKMLIRFSNGSIIKIGGADEPDSWRGIEFVAVVFDEAKHIKESMWSTIILPVMAGPLPEEKVKLGVKRWAAFCYTPEGNNWVTDMFDDACCLDDGGVLPDCGRSMMLKPKCFASRLDAEKAGIMSDSALAQAKAEMPIALYDQELRCSRVTQEERTLITSSMLNELGTGPTVEFLTNETRKIVSIDPAFEGDICKIMGIVNSEVVEERSIHPTKTDEIKQEGKIVAKLIGTKNFIVDTGWNPGVADALADDEAEYMVQKFNSASKPIDDRFYANKRAEAYAYSAERVRKLLVVRPTNQELLRQLPVAARYKTQSGGRLLIIPKSEIRKILGRSPDDADCWVMGQYGLNRVEPEKAGVVHFKKSGIYVPSNYRLGVA